MSTKPRFKGQPAVDAYGDGGFRLAEQRFEGSVIVTPQQYLRVYTLSNVLGAVARISSAPPAQGAAALNCKTKIAC